MKKLNILSILILFSLLGVQPLFADEDKDGDKSKFARAVDHAIEKADSVYNTYQERQADKSFGNMAYVRAIKKYSSFYEKNIRNEKIIRNLAVSYYKVSDTENAEQWFSRLVATGAYQAEDVYMYAQSLKYNSKYEHADMWMKRYKELNPNDTRAIKQLNSLKKINEILKTERYNIKEAGFNSKYSDFGAVVNNGQVVFATGRNDEQIIRRSYAWKENPYLDVYVTSETGGFLSAENFSSAVNSIYHDGPVCFNSEGNEIFFTRNNISFLLPKKDRKGVNHLKILTANKSGDSWSNIEELPFNNTDYSCGHPCLTKDNSTLYFASDMPGGFGGTDIWMVERTDSGWTQPVNLGAEINTEGEEMFPFIHESGELYFASNGHLGLGGLDVFVSRKIGGKYLVKNMGNPMNSERDDFSLFLKEDGVNGYFSSNRTGGTGDDDIYAFEITDRITFALTLEGITKDKKTGEALPFAKVEIKNENGELILMGESDQKGEFSIEVVPESKYTIDARKEKFEDGALTLNTTEENVKGSKVKAEVLLMPVAEWGVFGFIYEKESGKGEQDVQVTITAKESGEEIFLSSNEEGKFRQLLKPETDYDILLSKQKYFTRRGAFTTKAMEPGWIDIKEFIEVEMEEIVVGKTIEIPNIYYDLAKWNIREDAATELDKVVQFLLDNPTIRIELGSHTDARGSARSNQSLSQKRAQSAVDYIVNSDIAKNRIKAKGYGESKLKNHCKDGIRCSEEDHQANRRTEIQITDF